MSDDPGPGTLGEEMEVFVDRVRREAGLERSTDAEELARATVRALGEQVTPESAEHLTASLPEELISEITAHATTPPAAFDRDAFLDRVAGELGGTSGAGAGDDRDRVERRVHAVLATVREWAPTGQIETTLGQLPPALAGMFA